MRILPRALDYSDVLIVPQRSSLDSREDVDLHRVFRTKHGDLSGIPIIASNMWNIGTPICLNLSVIMIYIPH